MRKKCRKSGFKLHPSLFKLLTGVGDMKWTHKKLSQVATILMGQSPPGSTYNETGQGLPFFQGVKDFGARYPSERVYCTAPTRIAEEGDILFSVRAPIGSINRANQKCAIGRGLSAIRASTPSDTAFLEFLLRSMNGGLLGLLYPSMFRVLVLLRRLRRLLK